MERISDETFCRGNYEYDKIIALHIQNDGYYFLGWMEDAQEYKIQMSRYPWMYKLSEDDLIVNENPYTAIIENPQFNCMECLYILDSNGKPAYDEDKNINAYEKFLSIANNHGSDSEDHDIFITTTHEFSDICDSLRPGDYVFIFDDIIDKPE